MRRRYLKNELIWVAPGAVHYDREDIEFLLSWLRIMREGGYPVEPEDGYIGGKRSGVSSHAYYEAACQVAAEIDERLRRTHQDRDLVETYYCEGWPPGYSHDEKIEMIAIRYFMPTREVKRRINSAVSYISSGPCPRWLNCIDCKKYQACRRKKRVGIDYEDWKGHRYKNSALRKKSLTK